MVARWDDRAAPCPTCGAPTERLWKASAAAIGDECDFYDPNFERRFTSRSEHDRVIKEAGLVRKVKHRGKPGSDKSEFTQRWDVCPAALLISEEDRLAHWHATEAAIASEPRAVTLIAPEPEPVFTPAQLAELSAVAARVGL